MPWPLIANIVLFQMGWFACLTLASSWSLLVVVGILLLHFIFIVPTCTMLEGRNWHSEVVLLLQVAAIGGVLECIYLLADILVRTDGFLWPPIWLLMLWLLFGTTLRYSLAWLRQKILLSSLLAAIAGPASYYAGVQLNDTVMFGSSLWLSLFCISISWALVFPFLLRIAIPLKTYND